MRLFTGIDLPEDVRNALERLLIQLRTGAHLRWSPVYNLHITTRFIGEWPDARLDELKQALAQVPGRAAIDIKIAGLGWFPNARRPRVFWAGIHAGSELAQLAADTNTALTTIGLAADDREFAPHLTLARIKGPVPLDNLHEALDRLGECEFASFQADRFHLFRSQPGAAGSIYTKVAEFRFA
jgi:2'-5' RNA ligase